MSSKAVPISDPGVEGAGLIRGGTSERFCCESGAPVLGILPISGPRCGWEKVPTPQGLQRGWGPAGAGISTPLMRAHVVCKH